MRPYSCEGYPLHGGDHEEPSMGWMRPQCIDLMALLGSLRGSFSDLLLGGAGYRLQVLRTGLSPGQGSQGKLARFWDLGICPSFNVSWQT